MCPGDESSEKHGEVRFTDRRRFTEDGEMREGHDATPEPSAPEPEAPAAKPAPSAAASSNGQTVDAGYQQAGGGARAAREAPGSAGREAVPGGGAPVPGVFDLGIQAVFYIFWQSAMVALGASIEGSPAPGQVDLSQAREAIALLKLLEEKTAGNLDAEEAETLGQLLHDAQLRYVQVARATGATT